MASNLLRGMVAACWDWAFYILADSPDEKKHRKKETTE